MTAIRSSKTTRRVATIAAPFILGLAVLASANASAEDLDLGQPVERCEVFNAPC